MRIFSRLRSMEVPLVFKIIVLGQQGMPLIYNKGVGKSSMLIRYMKG